MDSLRPGLETAAPIIHPRRPTTELANPGVVLDEVMIATMARLGVRQAWVRWPSLDFLDSRIDRRVTALRGDVYELLKADFQAAQATTVGVGQYVRYCSAISNLVCDLLSAGHAGGGVQTAALFDHDHGLFNHSAAVAYLALTLALRLETYLVRERRAAGAVAACDITNLGVGAMLHDLGKLQAPSTVDVHEPLDGPPSKAYASHPRRGFTMIGERISPTARAVVLHHHQRFDGSGFPDMEAVTRKRRAGPLRGRQIHIFSRIVGLCDTFDHLCHDADGRGRPVVAALHDLVHSDLHRRFDPILLRGLLVHVPPFALGNVVRLCDGRLAAVIGLSAKRPCRPQVRLLQDDSPATRDIDLSKRADLHIREALGVNVEKWLFELPPVNAEAAAAAG
ncbi:MAG: HD domain-containing protein [Planctomycetes bacterium]|nr:HD domain-containing protein [Planctomycetota bacterium]